LSTAEILAQLNGVGAVVAAATPTLAPADRKLYPLRDVTGTVESIPLIASSIMSKKIAEGAGALVLDVKVGSGAFMKTLADARELARSLVDIGVRHGVRVSAVLTDMATPLGVAVGNAVEVAEAVDVLRGGGPADVVALTVTLAREMLSLAGVSDVDPAEVLSSGRVYDVWRRMIRAQGGDPDAPLPQAAHRHLVTASIDGVLARLDAYPVGVAAWRLGAGRARKEDPVRHAAGVLCLAKPGDRVSAGQPLLELRTDDPALVPAALAALEGGWAIADSAPPPSSLVLDTLRG
jgi:thymidine phosphorylase